MSSSSSRINRLPMKQSTNMNWRKRFHPHRGRHGLLSSSDLLLRLLKSLISPPPHVSKRRWEGKCPWKKRLSEDVNMAKMGLERISPLLLWFQYKRSNIGERYVFTLRCPWLRRKKATRCSHCNFRQHNKSDLWLGGGQERNLRYSHHFCKHSYKYNSDSPLHVRKNVKIYMYLRCGQNCVGSLTSHVQPT